MTREQMAKRQRAVAIEIANCDIDEQGFIYTVTSSKQSDTDILKKLNPAGENIYTNMGYDGYIFGNGRQKGLFTSPTAVETFQNRVYVSDDQKNSITVFKLTEFGEIVQGAIEKFNRGLYEEAKEPFEEILQRDSNYWYAYIGLGNAYYTMGENELAMKYFYQNSRSGYNRAFKEYRMEQIRKYFNVFIIVIIVLVIGLIVLSKVLKAHKKKKAAKAAAGGDGNAV